MASSLEIKTEDEDILELSCGNPEERECLKRIFEGCGIKVRTIVSGSDTPEISFKGMYCLGEYKAMVGILGMPSFPAHGFSLDEMYGER